MIPVLGSQPAGDVSHKPGGRLSLLSAHRAVSAVTLATLITIVASPEYQRVLQRVVGAVRLSDSLQRVAARLQHDISPIVLLADDYDADFVSCWRVEHTLVCSSRPLDCTNYHPVFRPGQFVDGTLKPFTYGRCSCSKHCVTPALLILSVPELRRIGDQPASQCQQRNKSV